MIASQFGDHNAKYRAYINLGNAHVLLSEVDKGIECYISAMNLVVEKGDKVREAQCCFYIACSSSLLRQFSSAMRLHCFAHEYQSHIGSTAQDVKATISAKTYHLRHLSLARRMNDCAGQARAYNSLATVYANLREYAKAAYFLACNRALAAEVRYHFYVVRVCSLGSYIRLCQQPCAIFACCFVYEMEA
ncbi:unnamed protein product [Cylicostephanus goldi]|uniref:Rapsyn myristoylation/linker region N-terminal domain-containing protein n=1 Tax=Cylicostephanus goldi TaxID=71465 RepID=A0A3P6RUM2_CYLGO|nr:unnamed protein product [Cylicostephanus goldi]